MSTLVELEMHGMIEFMSCLVSNILSGEDVVNKEYQQSKISLTAAIHSRYAYICNNMRLVLTTIM